MDFKNKAARQDYLLKLDIEDGGEVEVNWDAIQDKPETFPPTIGTTATTAKAGNYQPTWAQVTGKPTTFPSTWDTVSGKPATFPSTWATVSGKPTTFPPVSATTTVVGGVNQAEAVADVAAAPTMEEFNALLAVLRTAGILAT